LLKLFTSRTFS